ncbi:MAG: Rad52/Rad22 family DNA repair protein [Armatimonadota bacterium]
MELTREVMEALGAPFPEDEIDFLPRATSGGKALGLPYIDARDVMRRLDAVVGPGNWSYDFELVAPDGKFVKGKLTVCGVTKCDAGEASTEDEVLKSAVSDALKRCAVHFGIGRYLYYLPKVWAPFDSQRRQFTERPRISPAAIERALAICGVASRPQALDARPAERSGERPTSVASRPPAPRPPAPPVTDEAAEERKASRPAPAPAAAAPTAPAAPAPDAEGEKRSIWTAGAAGAARAERPAPESSGDRAAARGDASADTPEAMNCSAAGCGKALTKGQHNMSVRAFGRPLCPACQKEAARAGA